MIKHSLKKKVIELYKKEYTLKEIAKKTKLKLPTVKYIIYLSKH